MFKNDAARRWLRAFATPQTLCGALVFVAGLYALLSAPKWPRVERVNVVLEGSDTLSQTRQEVPLTLINREGLERTLFLELSLPAPETLRFEAILAELRRLMIEEGVWPESLPAPRVFVVNLSGGERVTVLNFQRGAPVAVSTMQEGQILTSIQSTMQRNGIERTHILINGRPSATFLGHRALETVLE